MRYMGSKARFANEILPIILKERKEGQYYVEPFCGGCNTLDKVEGKRIGADANKYLIAMWKFIVEKDFSFPQIITKEQYAFYRQLRRTRNSQDIDAQDAMIGWVGHMASFNGRFFEGYSGHKVKTNCKQGYRDYISENIRNITAQANSLRGVDFYWSDYANLNIPPQSLIYCDPPYKNTTSYKTSRHFDYDKFYDWCRTMKNKGHTIFVSEYAMPNDFSIVWQRETKSYVNFEKVKKATECLFKL